MKTVLNVLLVICFYFLCFFYMLLYRKFILCFIYIFGLFNMSDVLGYVGEKEKIHHITIQHYLIIDIDEYAYLS